jgi:hypothetical protein
MRYTEIINENYRPIKNPDEVMQKYQQVIKDFINNDIKLYRGFRETGNIIFGNTDGMQRTAKNTYNFVNALTSILPSWEGWPKRPESFICSNNLNTAMSYGTPYVVIPLEHQPIAVSTKADFWYTLPVRINFNTDLPGINYILYMFLKFGNVNGLSVYQEEAEHDPNKLISGLTMIVDLIKSMKNTQFENDITEFHSMFKSGQEGYSLLEMFIKYGVEETLDNILDPSENNSLINDITLLPEEDFRNEVWFSGKALMVNCKVWEEFKAKFDEI